MMGRHSWGQENLFYVFDLDKHVPADYLLRAINQLLDFGDLRTHLEPYYSKVGRPSIDPELMIRMLLIGYCFGIRSERRLCEEIHLNLAYRWFCHFDLEDKVPDHSTLNSSTRPGRAAPLPAERRAGPRPAAGFAGAPALAPASQIDRPPRTGIRPAPAAAR